MAGTKRYNIKELAKKLAQIREHTSMTGFEPPPCECEPVMMGCFCGRFEYEKNLKNRSQELQTRKIAKNPKLGDVYTISRPPDTEIDYSEIPFRVWAKCEGKRVEVELVESDKNLEGFWWCWVNVSHITKQQYDEYWFPSDGLLK